MGFAEVAFELLVALLPLEAGAFEAEVTVMGIAAVTGIVSRFGPKETPTDNEVETCATAPAELVDAAPLLCRIVGSSGSESDTKGSNIRSHLGEGAHKSEW